MYICSFIGFKIWFRALHDDTEPCPGSVAQTASAQHQRLRQEGRQDNASQTMADTQIDTLADTLADTQIDTDSDHGDNKASSSVVASPLKKTKYQDSIIVLDESDDENEHIQLLR